MKKILALLLLTTGLFCTQTNAQTIDTQFGEPFQLENINRIKIIGSINNEYYLSKIESMELGRLVNGYQASSSINLVNSPKLLTFNSKFNLIRETPIPSLKVNGTKYKIQNILPGNNCFYINSVYVDKNTDQKVRIIQTLKENSTISEKPTFIDTFDNNSIFLKDEIADFDFSADSSKILAIHSNPTKRNENYSLNVKVYNGQFELLWVKNVSLPFDDKDFEFKSATISNEGKIFVLGLVDVKKDKRKSIYKVISIDKEEEVKLFDFETDKFIYDANINLNYRNELLCFGFYSDKKNKKDIYKYNGIFSMKIDSKTNKVIAKQSLIAPEDVLLKLYLGKQKYVKYGLNGFILSDIILKGDGSAIYVAEQRVRRETQKKQSNGSTSIKFQYYYNSVVVFNLNADLSLNYCTEILKSQYTVNDLGSNSSFAFCYENDNLHFVFNVDAEQKNREKYKNVLAMNPGKKWETIAVSIDSKGTKTQQKIFKDDSRMTIIPRWSKQINNSLFVIVGDRSTEPEKASLMQIATNQSLYMVKLGQITFR